MLEAAKTVAKKSQTAILEMCIEETRIADVLDSRAEDYNSVIT